MTAPLHPATPQSGGEQRRSFSGARSLPRMCGSSICGRPTRHRERSDACGPRPAPGERLTTQRALVRAVPCPSMGATRGTGGRGEAGRGWTQRGTTRRKGRRENLKGRGAGQQRPRASFFSSPPALLQLSDCRGPIPNHKTRKALRENETKLSEKMPPSVHVCVCNKEKLTGA